MNGPHAYEQQFPGFARARQLVWCHEVRNRVLGHLSETSYIDDYAVTAVHVNTSGRADRVIITAFTSAGARHSQDLIFPDGPEDHLDVAAEFDHDFTGLTVEPSSDLGRIIASETGWVIDLRQVRAYSPGEDLRKTQRAMFLAHLQDLTARGEVDMLSMFDDKQNPDVA